MSLAYRRVSKDFFKECPTQGGLGEAYSSNADMPEFAVISPNGNQIGPWMRCKDYIQDVWWGKRNNRAYSCHGFNYNPKTDPAPSEENLLLGMRWKGREADLPSMLNNIKSTVESVETKLKIPKCRRTRFSRVMGDMFVVYGSPEYLKAIRLVSFFTWLLRASFNNVGGKLSTLKNTPPVKKDVYYQKSGNAFIQKLTTEGISSIEDDWNKDGVYSVHNQGFVFASTQMKNEKKEDNLQYLKETDDWGF